MTPWTQPINPPSSVFGPTPQRTSAVNPMGIPAIKQRVLAMKPQGQVLGSSTSSMNPAEFLASSLGHLFPHNQQQAWYDSSYLTDNTPPTAFTNAQLDDPANGPDLQRALTGSAFRGTSANQQQAALRYWLANDAIGKYGSAQGFYAQYPNAIKPQGILPGTVKPTPTHNINVPGAIGADLAATISLGTLLSIMGGF